MPQLDKVTFLSITFSLLFIYIFQYLLLSVTHGYKFISGMKLSIKRSIFIFFNSKLVSYTLHRIFYFPWIYSVQE